MLSDLFKRLFGETNVTYRGFFHEEEDNKESFGSMGLPSSVEEDLRRRYLSDSDENDTPHSLRGQPDGLSTYHYYQSECQPMNEMFSEIQEMFQGLLHPHRSDGFFTFDQETPAENSDINPRSRMLDENDSATIDNSPNHLFRHFHSLHDNHYNSPDKDLDDDVGKGHLSIDQILQPNDRIQQHHHDSNLLSNQMPHLSSSYSFSSVTTTRQSDGSVESKRTTRDSSGNEETFVERIIGDKRHSIKRKVDKSGAEETVESFLNMENGESEDFKQKWQELRGESSPLTSDSIVSSSCNNSSGLYDNIKQFFRL